MTEIKWRSHFEEFIKHYKFQKDKTTKAYSVLKITIFDHKNIIQYLLKAKYKKMLRTLICISMKKRGKKRRKRQEIKEQRNS